MGPVLLRQRRIIVSAFRDSSHACIERVVPQPPSFVDTVCIVAYAQPKRNLDELSAGGL